MGRGREDDVKKDCGLFYEGMEGAALAATSCEALCKSGDGGELQSSGLQEPSLTERERDSAQRSAAAYPRREAGRVAFGYCRLRSGIAIQSDKARRYKHGGEDWIGEN